MKPRYWLIALAIAGIAVVLWPWVKAQLSIDSCLDRGGRWNYQAEQCESVADK